MSHTSTITSRSCFMIDQPISTQDVNKAWEYWYPLVYGYFFRRVNNQTDVEDLTANTLTALLTNSEVQNPKAFVWQTAKNQLYKFIQQKANTPYSMDMQSPDSEHIINQHSLHHQSIAYDENELDQLRSPHYMEKMTQLIECCKNQLTTEDYQLVCASIIDNKNSTELGQIFQIKANTIRQKLKRNFDKLRKHCTELWQQQAQQQ